MKRNIFILLILVMNSFVFAQKSDVKADSTEKTKTSLSLASIYASDASYYGQTASERLPYVLANASLNFASGFFISAGAYKLITIGSGISGIDLSAGFDFKLTKKLSSSISYTRSFFPDSSLLLQSTNVNMASASLSYDWKVFNTGLNVDYAIGDENALYMTFNISKSLDLGSIGAKDYISIEPTFQLAGATQRITTTEVIPPPQRGGFLPLPLSKKARKPQYREVTETSFDLLSYNLKLPLAYNRANYA
ncbi:MAG: hypothetical protein H7Y07_02300, partial [Pyrinomonadaceae bacterium]|nr:hypothetical protein [Sphingobacteriaceae bacterium]